MDTQVLSSLGIRCFLFDLDAHGESNIQLLTYKDLNPSHAELILAHTQLNPAFSSKQNSILGISTGALFATQTFIQSESWNSLCLLSLIPTPLYYLQYNIQQTPLTFNQPALKYISDQIISATIGTIPLHFDLIQTLPKISKPLWIAHGIDDEIYPIAQLQKDFPFINSSNNIQLHTLPKTDHYNSYADVQTLSLLLAEWLYQHHCIKNQAPSTSP
jgi:pimeloyl-ACP methyl ester carboxylesterase